VRLGVMFPPRWTLLFACFFLGNTRCLTSQTACSELGLGSKAGQHPIVVQFSCDFHAKLIPSHTTVDMPLACHPDNDGYGKCDQLCPFAGKAAIACICGVNECKKKVHVECYMRRILPSIGKPPLAPLPDQTVVCTRLHHKAVIELANPSKRLTLTNDAKPETPNVTSSQVLNDWITTPGNYDICRDKGETGFTKKHHCQVISAKINNLTLSECTWESVQTMTAACEDTWRSCNNWINNTRQGCLLNPLEGQDHFDACVKARCNFYYDWEPIMTDRAGNNPAVTSNDLDKSDDDESEDPKEDDDEDNEDGDDGNKKPKGKSSAKASSVHSQSPAGSISVIDSETKEMFSLATSSSADLMKLMTEQHAKRMAIENRRLELEEERAKLIDWKAKREEVSHKCKLCEKHNKMKDNGKSDEFILMVLPQAKDIIDALAKTESPTRTSPRKRNR